MLTITRLSIQWNNECLRGGKRGITCLLSCSKTMSAKGAPLKHRPADEYDDDDDEDGDEEGDFEEEYYGEEGGDMPPVVEMSKPAAAPPVASAPAAANSAMEVAMSKAVSQMTMAFQTMATLSLKQIEPPRASFSTAKATDVTKIFVDYKIRDTVHNLASRNRGELTVKVGTTARLRFENPAIEAGLKAGKDLAVLLKAVHKGTFSTDTAHEYQYMALPGTPTHTVQEADLRASNGAFELVLVEKSLDSDLRAFIKENGRFHGKNFDSSYTLIPNANLVLLSPQTPLANLWPKLGDEKTGQFVKAQAIDGGNLLVAYNDHFKEACRMCKVWHLPTCVSSP